MITRLCLNCCFLLLVCGAYAQESARGYFIIKVVDETTRRGVPLVELKTVNGVSWWTDSNGIIAFDEPGLVEQEVYFHIRSHGYDYPKDFFGNRGVKLKTSPGQNATVAIKRLNIAERLYRMTGQGIYADSLRAGLPTPTKHPVLNGQVMGQDTVIATPYRGKIYWFWGDTDRASYPLGNFGASGATSEWPDRGGLDPSVGVDLTYFVGTNGFSKPMCPLPGQGLRWIEGLFTVPDSNGLERLIARLATHNDLGPAREWHLMLFNDEKEVFEPIQHWPIHETHDSSHPFRAKVDGVNYFFLYPNWRVKADLSSLRDLSKYEAFTCVIGDGQVRGKETNLERDATGRLRYSWKPGADRINSGKARELIASGKLKPGENWIHFHNFETGAPIQAGRGSVYWNEFRKRWVMIASAEAGEIWFGEGDTPVGPWVYGRRIVFHDDYNFYNPTQHPFFDQEGGRLIYFEGTYTAAFSKAKQKTPRYDYNQIMYRLTLDDTRLALPAPVYAVTNASGKIRYLMREAIAAEKLWDSISEIAFFAIPPDRSQAGLAPIFSGTRSNNSSLGSRESFGANDQSRVLFLALSATNAAPGSTVTGIWESKVRTSNGSEFAFEMELSQRGTEVSVVSTDPQKQGTGQYIQGRLELSVTMEKKPYLFTAQMRDGKLAGEWKAASTEAGEPRGTWSATWKDPTPAEHKSSAVITLYEYLGPDGRRIYSTDPELKQENLKRSTSPFCRVWKNPMAQVILDPKPQPMPMGRR